MLTKKPLTKEPRRTDFTDREFCSIIGGLLGGLSQSGSISDLRNAVKWWAETDEAWAAFERMKKQKFDDAGFPIT